MRALLVLVVLSTGCRREGEDRMLGLIRAPPGPVCELPAQLTERTLQQEARLLMRAGKWAEAHGKFSQLVELNPHFGGGTIRQYLARCEQEIPNEQALDAAEAHLAKDELAPAAAALSRVTSDTLQEERRSVVKRLIDKAIQSRMARAGGLLNFVNEPEEMRQVLALANEVLAADANHAEARGLKELAEKAFLGMDELAQEPSPAVIQHLFRKGDVMGAIKFATACQKSTPRCRTMRNQLLEFSKKATGVHRMKEPDLRAMLELARLLSGSDDGGAPALGVRSQLVMLKF